MSNVPVVSNKPVDTSSLGSGNYANLTILNNIFNLCNNMITSLQDAAATQSNRLTLFSNWQTDYTDALDQIHTFTKGDGYTISSDSSDRTAANQVNTANTTAMQGRQSVVSDDAKALQSNVDSTNDAVNQQSTLGTAILQQMSTLLSSIFSSTG